MEILSENGKKQIKSVLHFMFEIHRAAVAESNAGSVELAWSHVLGGLIDKSSAQPDTAALLKQILDQPEAQQVFSGWSLKMIFGKKRKITHSQLCAAVQVCAEVMNSLQGSIPAST